MKFTFLSSSALLAAVATPAVHAVRGGIVGGGRSLEQAFDGLDLSLSMSMPAEAASAELDTSSVEAKDATAASSKAAKTSPCAHRLDLLHSALIDLGEDMDDEDIKELCHYQPEGLHPELPSGPNFGCPLGYFPEAPPEFQWSQGIKEFWGPFVGSEEEADVYVALEMFCECHTGIEDGCATKIPREVGTKKWVDYCQAAGVWNGDFLLEDLSHLSTSVQDELFECGCHFVGAMRAKIDDCPGVNLGEFFCEAEDNGVSVCPDGR